MAGHIGKKGIIIAGPTASGKSGFAVKLSQMIDGGAAVINADSMQIYRDLPIITAIPTENERGDIAHYGYGVLDGAVRCSVGGWLELTRGYIDDVLALDKVPVLVGGTGMYIRAAMDGISPIPDIPNEVRQNATEMHDELGGAMFRAALAEQDPVLAARLHDGDRQRLIRGMEVVLATGTPLSTLQDIPPEGALGLDWCVIRLNPPRDELYAKIDQRYPLMLKNGGMDEAKAFADRGLDPSLPLMKAVGLPPLMRHLREEVTLAAAIEDACRDSRRYAKRQTTWFNNQLTNQGLANFCEDSSYNAQFSESFFEKILSNITN